MSCSSGLSLRFGESGTIIRMRKGMESACKFCSKVTNEREKEEISSPQGMSMNHTELTYDSSHLAQCDRLDSFYPRRLFLSYWRSCLKLRRMMDVNEEKCSSCTKNPTVDSRLSRSWSPSAFAPSGGDLKSKSFSPMNGRVLVMLFYLLLLLGPAAACGPGRGAGRRRAPRKLTPLVFDQHVPNVPETALSASGLSEGNITRGNKRFKNLVPNYNPDIIFRDDEGSGADRLMTQRCKEKLNTLAISVMNQWPGVKLRVIDAWDEDGFHGGNSLHYEGRAVDIMTSDKQRSKLGMLARLAVEAGFDWVHYESKNFIHCSVKPDSSQSGRTGGCFSRNSTVETPSGQKRISEIQPGDQVLSVNPSGEKVFSDVLLFLDRNDTEVREFYELTTASGRTLTLTPSHLIYTIQPESLSPLEKKIFSFWDKSGSAFLDKAVISFAKFVQIGDFVLVHSGDEQGESPFLVEKVVEMRIKVLAGVYAPLTAEGNLIVDGVLSSCYAVIDDHDLDHWAFLPLRLGHNLAKGMAYLWKSLSRFITFRHHEIGQNSSPNMTNSSINSSSSSRVRNSSSSSSNDISENEVGDQGIHWYAQTLYSISRYLLPSHLNYES